MHTIIHHVEGRIEEGWQWPHVEMGDEEASPFFRCEGIKNNQHFIRIGLEPGNGLLAWQFAECLGVFVEFIGHNQQTKCTSWFALASHIPTLQVAFGHINHMTDHILSLPLGGAGLHIPVLWVVNDLKEICALSANDVEYQIFVTVIHRIDRHKY